ncbi:MAG: helix-turn-helix domain-containing protein, partial [Acidobacteriota bacterium]
MTQDQVATRFGLSRSTVAQIELGNRSVSSLELKRLAELYGRDLREFLLDEFEERDALVALFRVHPDVADDPRLSEALRGCAALCREASSLERVLELAERRVQPAEYHLAPPQAKWDAIQQGEKVANLERRRLDLGHAPVWDVPEILERQGVRCTEMPLPDDLSGLFLAGGEVGLCIVVNSAHHLRRRAFSYAHEYGHLLLDRSRRGDVCRYGAREELTEVRANTFAASFLLPADGVYDFLRSLGKAEEARATATVFDEARPLVVQHRTPARSQDVQLYDIVHLAHHFGGCFEAAVYRRRN